MLLDHFQDANLEFELFVELRTHFKDLKGVVAVVFVVEHLEHLPESTGAQDFYYLKTVGNMIANERLVIFLLIPKALLILDRKKATLRRCAL